MSDDTDLINLYSRQILALAADIPHSGRLPGPQASASRRSPLCGSTVVADVDLEDGKIAGFAQDVRACALGQASASILGAQVIGRSEPEIRKLRDELRAMLRNQGPVPSAPFEGYKVLEPARDYKNRHASILLAVEATLEAMETASLPT